MLTLILCPFHPRVTAVARKRPWSFCQKCRSQVTSKHAFTPNPTKSEWADYAAVQTECGNPIRKRAHTQLAGNTRSPSSQLAEPLWTDHGLKSRINLPELISTLKIKRRRGMNGQTFCQNPLKREKSHHYHHTATTFFALRNSFVLDTRVFNRAPNCISFCTLGPQRSVMCVSWRISRHVIDEKLVSEATGPDNDQSPRWQGMEFQAEICIGTSEWEGKTT